MRRGSDWYRRPEQILAHLMRREALGLHDKQHYYRAVVLAVDQVGGQLQNKSGSGGLDSTGRDGKTVRYPAIVGVDNPRGSVKARLLTSGYDRLLEDEDVRVYWPLLPQDQIGIPISPGEHVYVVFEDVSLDHGMWVSRVPGHESANSFQGVDSYAEPSAPRSAMDSFEPNEPQYQRTEQYAGLAPGPNLNDLFDGKS